MTKKKNFKILATLICAAVLTSCTSLPQSVYNELKSRVTAGSPIFNFVEHYSFLGFHYVGSGGTSVGENILANTEWVEALVVVQSSNKATFLVPALEADGFRSWLAKLDAGGKQPTEIFQEMMIALTGGLDTVFPDNRPAFSVVFRLLPPKHQYSSGDWDLSTKLGPRKFQFLGRLPDYDKTPPENWFRYHMLIAAHEYAHSTYWDATRKPANANSDEFVAYTLEACAFVWMKGEVPQYDKVPDYISKEFGERPRISETVAKMKEWGNPPTLIGNAVSEIVWHRNFLATSQIPDRNQQMTRHCKLVASQLLNIDNGEIDVEVETVLKNSSATLNPRG
ncbi:MAG: hypothetical protein JNN20_12355 [Betaproteobacteria bacterium]|nr:hypothetical protein [Betaproteobacteria bacterium]